MNVFSSTLSLLIYSALHYLPTTSKLHPKLLLLQSINTPTHIHLIPNHKMYATTFIILPLSILGLLAPAVLAQNKCQTFVTAPSRSSTLQTSEDPGFIEITRDCAVSPEGDKGIGQNGDACADLGRFDGFNTDNSIFVTPDSLPEAVEVRIFRKDLTEGFMKFAGQDLNFEGGDCADIGSENIAVKRCEFDC